MVHSYLGHLPCAREMYERVLRFFEGQVGDRNRAAVALMNLGNIEYILGDYSAAASRHRRALEYAQGLGIPRLEAIARINLAWIHVAQNEWDQAASLATQSVQQQTDHHIAEFLPEAHRVLAHIAVGRNRLGQARRHAEQALELARQQHNPFEEAGAERILGEILHRTRDFGTAEGHLQHSLDLFGQIGDRFETARTRRQLAWLRWDQGNERGALEHAIPALTTFVEMHARREAADMQAGNRLCFRLPCMLDETAELCRSSMTAVGWQEVERTAAGSGGEILLNFGREDHCLTVELETDAETTVVSLRAP